jgi:uncharacterized protein YhaN
MSTAPDTGNGSQNPQAEAAGNVDQIRQILFGGQMRDYDTRFKQLEEKLTKQAQAFSVEMRERADALTAQIKVEKAERTESDKELSRELRELTKTVDRGLAHLQDHAERLHKEMLKHVAEQTKALHAEVRADREALAAVVEREVADLRHAKADREVLGDILAEMAARLKGEERGHKGK